MSALMVRRMRRMSTVKGFCETPECRADSGGRRAAVAVLFICGHPAGRVCTTCAKTARDVWDSALAEARQEAA